MFMVGEMSTLTTNEGGPTLDKREGLEELDPPDNAP